jgi:hypothetical protein
MTTAITVKVLEGAFKRPWRNPDITMTGILSLSCLFLFLSAGPPIDPIFFPAGGFTAERLADAGRLAGAFEEEVEAAGRRITGIVNTNATSS